MAEEHRLSVVEENLSALAVAIARQIIGRELRGDADAIADMVRRALVEFPIDQPLRVRLSPQDLSTIASLSTRSGDAVPIAPGRDLRWLADPLLEPGSCVVEGKERIVDGRADRALERIYRRLTGD
jgi:flagellar assembly protein FliH